MLMSKNHWHLSEIPPQPTSLPPIAPRPDPRESLATTMTSSLIHIERQRAHLAQELSAIRQACLRATRNDDFRAVARLTLEAARLNHSIVEADVQAEMAR
jgi:hypothetical protein